MKLRIQAIIVIVSALLVTGCSTGNSGLQTVPATPAPKGSQTDSIKNNPAIPEAAKRGIMGSQGGR